MLCLLKCICGKFIFSNIKTEAHESNWKHIRGHCQFNVKWANNTTLEKVHIRIKHWPETEITQTK